MINDLFKKEGKVYSTSMRHWPADDRPREKLVRYGEGKLTDSELLAILIRTGIKGINALTLAQQLMMKFKTFREMSHSDPAQWKEFKGLGQAKIAQIRSALEIGRRFRENEQRAQTVKVKSARDVADILMPQMRDLKIEIFKVVYLNGQNAIISIDESARGSVNFAAPIIREILQKGLQVFASAIIGVHNHPSGEVVPSSEDRRFTRKLAESGDLLQIKLIDHIIIGDNRFFSFADEGLLA
jgi:DNA repair protein RadC